MIVRRAIPVDAVQIARIQVDTWRSAYTGIVADETLQDRNYEQSQIRFARAIEKGYLLVAVDEEEVIGFAAWGPERTGEAEFTGEIYALYVLQAKQGKGAGRMLMQHSAKALNEAGHESMLIWVLRDNVPARRFYEAMGGVLSGEKKIDINGQILPEVSYGWKNIRQLIARD